MKFSIGQRVKLSEAGKAAHHERLGDSIGEVMQSAPCFVGGKPAVGVIVRWDSIHVNSGDARAKGQRHRPAQTICLESSLEAA